MRYPDRNWLRGLCMSSTSPQVRCSNYANSDFSASFCDLLRGIEPGSLCSKLTWDPNHRAAVILLDWKILLCNLSTSTLTVDAPSTPVLFVNTGMRLAPAPNAGSSFDVDFLSQSLQTKCFSTITFIYEYHICHHGISTKFAAYFMILYLITTAVWLL